MLRNLVTSLFEHEQIKTTLPKARDTARLAEKIITMGKKGNKPAQERAAAFLLKPELLPKLFGTFAERYSQRPGGYTRIHKFGNRPGDNAPHAVLELVDNPRDLRYEMTSRAIGREMLKEKLRDNKPVALINSGVEGVEDVVVRERQLAEQSKGLLRPKTRWNLQKVLRFRNDSAVEDISQRAGHYADSLLASPIAFKTMQEEEQKTKKTTQPPMAPQIRRVGQVLPGQTTNAMAMSRGALGLPQHRKIEPHLSLRSIFGSKHKST